jgi:hypothetical protein
MTKQQRRILEWLIAVPVCLGIRLLTRDVPEDGSLPAHPEYVDVQWFVFPEFSCPADHPVAGDAFVVYVRGEGATYVRCWEAK